MQFGLKPFGLKKNGEKMCTEAFDKVSINAILMKFKNNFKKHMKISDYLFH